MNNIEHYEVKAKRKRTSGDDNMKVQLDLFNKPARFVVEKIEWAGHGWKILEEVK